MGLTKATALMLLALSSTAHASPKITVESQYYEIAGLTAKALRQSLDENRKMLPSGEKFDAYTSWQLKWQYRWTAQGRLCKMKKVTTSVHIKFMLPRWINQQEADQTLQRRWDHYYTALVKHEEGHQQTGIDAATEIGQQLRKLQAGSCEQLHKKADELAEQLLKKYQEKDKAFDKSTNHGMNDGAVFP